MVNKEKYLDIAIKQCQEYPTYRLGQALYNLLDAEIGHLIEGEKYEVWTGEFYQSQDNKAIVKFFMGLNI
jgi:hypothetical protein